MKRWLRSNGLGVFFLLIFLLSLVGQAVAGFADYNNQQVADGLSTVGFGRYLASSDFAADVAENWQSEYLQFLLFIVATVWLVQRGSTESKDPGDAGTESDQKQLVGSFAQEDSPRWAAASGFRRSLYANSLGLVMGLVFLLSWVAQFIAGRSAYNERQLGQLEAPVGWAGYLTSADFWSRTLQNWQSEFLAVASMAILSIYLRQRGSAESKPVGAPRDATGDEG
jgi:membrane protein implicated in regulation of membrane protease activity